MGNVAGSSGPHPYGADEDLDISIIYTITGSEWWDLVTVKGTGVLRVPDGATLRATGIALEDGSVLEIDGGTVQLSGARSDGNIELVGECRWFNLSDDATLVLQGSGGDSVQSSSWGSDATIDVVATEGIRIESSEIEVNGGTGHSNSLAWTGSDLYGKVSAGGNANLKLNVTGPGNSLLIMGSEIYVFGGYGGKAADGGLPPSCNVAGVGGGYSSGGDVGDYVGAGGSVETDLSAPWVTINASTLMVRGGQGGDAGDAPDVPNFNQAGSGGGGYSGGIASQGLSSREGDPGGTVYGHVGSGGDADLFVSAEAIEIGNGMLTVLAGDGGEAGSAGQVNSYCGQGGGGYSAGGGGSYWHTDGADGGDVTDYVGSGGASSSTLTASDTFTIFDSRIITTAGDGGNAGDGGSANSEGGAGGGGYSSAGGGGPGAAAGYNAGLDGGDGGSASGHVGAGGTAIIYLESTKIDVKSSTLTSEGGDGGDAGKAGTNSGRNAGGGGGGYSAGGGGGEGAGVQPEGLGGDGGTVSGNVSDGGDARLSIVASYPTISGGNDIKVIEGKGGSGTAASAPPTSGGEGTGRNTSNGTSFMNISMSIPSLIAPPDKFHITLIPRFRWANVSDLGAGGSLSHYHLQVDDDPNFGSPEITQSTVTSSHAPTSLEHGTYYWRVSAYYGPPPLTMSGWSEVWWFTYGPNRPPVVVNPLDDVVIRENDVDIVIGNTNDVFSDPDGDPLMFAVLLNPNIAVTFDEDGNISITPLAGWAGMTEITIVAREMYADIPLQVLHKVKITVRRSNDPPLITTLNFSKLAYEDNPYWIDFEAIDSDQNDEQVWSLDTTAEWLSIDSGSGRIEGTPRQEHIGTEWVEVTVRDELDDSDRVRFQLEVVNTNDDPRILTQPVTQWERDDPYSVSYEAEDLDPTNDVMTWELESNADFLSIDPRTGVLTDSLGSKSPGEYYVEVIVWDGNGGFDSRIFFLIIYFDNDPPVVDTIPTVEVMEEEITTYDLAPFIHDEDSGPEELVLSSEGREGMSIDGLELTFLYDAWVPDHTIVLSISDGTSDVAFELDVHVVPVNDPPIIVSVGPHTTSVSVEMDEGETTAFPITVTDEDNAAFQYTVESDWEGIRANPNGTMEVVTTADDVGVHHAILTIDDGAGGTDSIEIEITVLDVNYAPGTPSITFPEDGAIYTKGDPIELTASVFDPDMTQGHELTVTWISDISGKLHVSQTTLEDIGLILEQLPVGTHRITLKVSDGEFESSTSIGLTVKKVPKETDSFVTSPAGIALIITIIIVIAVAGLYLTMRNRTEGRRDGDGTG